MPTIGTRPLLLAEALRSVLTQSMTPHEIVVVHNGDVDATPTVPVGVRLLRLPAGSGVANARNLGVQHARGTHVAFLDDDDLWGKTYLESIMLHISSHDPDMLLGRLDAMHEGVVSPFMDATGMVDAHHVLVMNPGSTGSNTVVRRSAFLRMGGYDPLLHTGEDMGLLADFLLQGLKIEVVPQAQAILRQHDQDRLTRSDRVSASAVAFFRKYRTRMSWRQRCYFRWRLLDLRLSAGGDSAYRLDYLLLSALVVLIRMRPRDLWPGPQHSGHHAEG